MICLGPIDETESGYCLPPMPAHMVQRKEAPARKPDFSKISRIFDPRKWRGCEGNIAVPHRACVSSTDEEWAFLGLEVRWDEMQRHHTHPRIGTA